MTGPKVLVVEDDRDLMRWMGEQLTASGYQVISAGDGASAIMIAQKQRPYVIVLDIGLPGADGLMVMKRLKSLIPLSGIPVIVLTGKPLSPHQEDTLKSQAYTMLRKPVDMEELQAAIRSALGALGGPDTSESATGPRI
jgi:two-component system KDP operon response regulator KdpE